MKTFDELWKNLEENFDWERVHKVMVFLEWDWRFEGVPSIENLKFSSKEMLQKCYNEATLSDSISKSNIPLHLTNLHQQTISIFFETSIRVL